MKYGKRHRAAAPNEIHRLVRIMATSFVVTVVAGIGVYLWLVPPTGHR